MSRFGSCLANSRTGDVLFLIDQSGSLSGPKGSDPADKNGVTSRETAATYLAEQLAEYSTQTAFTVNLLVAGFSDTFHPANGWTALGPSTIGQVNTTIQQVTRNHSGYETDYWSALDGARADLAARPVSKTGQRCQAIVWFTDGEPHLAIRDKQQGAKYGTTKPYSGSLKLTTKSARDQASVLATNDLCRPQGLADQLRVQGVVTLAIGLGNANFDLMQGVAAGTNFKGSPCGAQTTPTPGRFFRATDINQLLLAFDALSSPGRPPITSTAGVCERVLCPGQGHTFVLDDSVLHVHVLGVTKPPIAGLSAAIRTPKGTVLDLPDHGATTSPRNVDGVGVTYSWPRPGTLEVDLSRPTGAAAKWAGQWALSFIDVGSHAPGATSTTNIHISGDLYPHSSVSTGQALHLGDPNARIQLSVVRGQGGAVDASRLESTIGLSAQVIDVDNHVSPIANGLTNTELASPLPLKLVGATVPGAATLRLTLAVTTKSTTVRGRSVRGTRLAPQSVDVPVTILPPVNYPTVLSTLDFGHITGKAHRVAHLSIEGHGCVWIDASSRPSVTASPSSVGTVSITAPGHENRGSCLSVNGTAKLDVTLSTTGQGSAPLSGYFNVSATSDVANQNPVVSRVKFTAELEKSLNRTHFLLALIVGIVLGPGIPLLLLYLSKWWSARIPGEPLLARQIPVRIEDGVLLRGHEPFELRSDDLPNRLTPVGAKGARRVEADGVSLRTRVAVSPTGANYVIADTPGLTGYSSAEKPNVPRSGFGRLPLAVHNHWLVLHDPQGPAEDASLLVLVSGEASDVEREALSRSARDAVPHIVRDLRARTASSGRTGDGVGGGTDISDSGFGRDTGPAEPAPDFGPAGFGSDGLPDAGFGSAGEADVSTRARPAGGVSADPPAVDRHTVDGPPADAPTAQEPDSAGGGDGWAWGSGFGSDGFSDNDGRSGR